MEVSAMRASARTPWLSTPRVPRARAPLAAASAFGAPWACRRRGAVCAASAAPAGGGAAVHMVSQHSDVPSSAQAILDRCAAALSDYRAHKAALGPWLREFTAAHGGRRPAAADAAAGGDPDLLGRFRAYQDARKRLMAEIPMLRREYERASEADAAARHRTGARRAAGAAAGVPGANANAAAGRTPAQAAQQWASAAQYRRAHAPREGAAAGAGAGQQLASADIKIVSPAPAAAPAPALELGRLAEKASAASAASGDPSVRMRSAALAALQYKTGGGGGGARGGAASAILQAPVPPRPKAGQPAVIAEVETARFDAYSGRRARALDADTRLDVVMGGGGATAAPGPEAAPASAAAAAAAPAPAAAEAAAAPGRTSAVLLVPVPPPPKAGQPAVIAEVVTARFDAYSGRPSRALDADTRLDVVFGGGGAAAPAPAAAPVPAVVPAAASAGAAASASGGAKEAKPSALSRMARGGGGGGGGGDNPEPAL
ncbi:MAG: hypothetical protein J3K34DRAFT_462288, partial [Monoraphidium minutum]